MKKFLMLFSIMLIGLLSAQTQMGNKFLEVGTSFTPTTVSSTGINFTTSDKLNTFNVGAEGGYFIADNLALKAGLGFGTVSYDGNTLGDAFSYKVGAKYYLVEVLPIGVDFNSAIIKDNDNANYVGLSAGYALFLGNNVSFEPTLRYDISTNDTYKDVFSAGLGINIFFK